MLLAPRKLWASNLCIVEQAAGVPCLEHKPGTAIALWEVLKNSNNDGAEPLLALFDSAASFHATVGLRLLRCGNAEKMPIYLLCDPNAHALRAPDALGLDTLAYTELQRAAAHMLRLDTSVG